MKKALVFGAGGFIGSHMVKYLKSENYFVRGVDLKEPDFDKSSADEFIIKDLSLQESFEELLTHKNEVFDEIYQYAADMGGAGYIFTGDNDANVMTNSIQINLNLLSIQTLVNKKFETSKTKIFYSSSACIYPEENQLTPDDPDCRESSAYPANPDSEYGWEKLFSERLYESYRRNHNIDIRIARFHNIFGPLGTYDGGREKVPAAICRKVALAEKEIEVWGDGKQTRSFLFIDECIQATIKLMHSDFYSPINIGSEEMVSINQLVEIVSKVAGKDISIKHIDGPLGVRGRNSNNDLIRKELDWNYSLSLEEGIEKTYKWIKDQLSV
ncbi:NAD-dependent epimerase/dehydratase family protein [Acidimicrobiia bacterium]|jgi:nucleoside-diphosphate-sugar epimerase|nr:NAD-dependent epimerase/dehydratase family protein [Acidimicrobiia bacterium]